MTTDNQGLPQDQRDSEVQKILASYTDGNGSRSRADLDQSIKICDEKCAQVPGFVELGEHHYGGHMRMFARLLDALARPAPEALPSAISWSGFNLHGNEASVREARRLIDRSDRLEQLEKEISARNAAPEALAREDHRDGDREEINSVHKARGGGFVQFEVRIDGKMVARATGPRSYALHKGTDLFYQHLEFDYAEFEVELVELLPILHKRVRNTVSAPETLGAAKGELSDAEIMALLPGHYYMDPPDGGSVTLLEQLQRMAKDAERYRFIRSTTKAVRADDGEGRVEVTPEKFDAMTDISIEVHKDAEAQAAFYSAIRARSTGDAA